MPLVADIMRYIQDLRSGADLEEERPQRLRRIGAKPREVSCVQHLQCCEEIFGERRNQWEREQVADTTASFRAMAPLGQGTLVGNRQAAPIH